MINVTEPFLPPFAEYQRYIEEIWKRNWLTNNGPLVNELELKLKKYLKLDHLLFVGNGTIALQMAIKALHLKGEIITTPFSYVATTSSIVWENCKPIFVDIDPKNFNINVDLIEEAITNKTSAILATHVYGIPCNITKIQELAKKHQLKIIFDAAHCFGVKYKGESLLNYGDISCISFHATKLFHTIEGGAVVSKDPEIIRKLSLLRNFGHDGFYKFTGLGINGKNSEMHAAMGLCNLNHIEKILEKRKNDSLIYDSMLGQLNYFRPEIPAKVDYNYSYYPLLFPTEDLCLKALNSLSDYQIYSRRYFYPSLSELDYVTSKSMSVSNDISKRILCLPMAYQLAESEIDMISRIILRSQRY